ncbi:MAG: chromate transporter, partial [Planctomycetes bacterium]|nr:chromate transporter [Planctomycetota bacterium]
MVPDPGATRPDGPSSLRELALLFLRLGATSFGGPAAHVAMMEREVVRRRRWLDEQRFLDLGGATTVIPGPNSTELALHIGWARRRWSGLVVSGLAFLLPAVLASAALAWAYVRYGALPEVAWILYGVKPVILAIVAQALWKLAPRAASTWSLRALGLAAIAAAAFGVHELVVLFGAGFIALVGRRARSASVASAFVIPHAVPALATAAARC